MFIAVEPTNPAFEGSHSLRSIALHELHHAKRWSSPGYGERLLDSLVSEGLATVYEIECTGVEPPYAARLDDLDTWWRAAQPLLADVGQHQRWFFGGQDIPRWVGYSLGTELARRLLAKQGLRAAEAVALPADEFRPSW